MEVPHRQFIGEKDIVKELTCVKDSNGSWVENPKIEISKIYRIDVEKRPLQRIVGKMDHDTLSSLAKDPFIIYEIGQYDSNNPGVSPGRPGTTFKVIGYYDAFNDTKYTTYNPSITLNGENINVNELEHFDIYKPEDVKSLTTENGVIVNITYSYVYINFTIENETSDYLQPLQVAIARYKQNQLEFKHYIEQLNSCEEEEIQDICNNINNNRIESNELYTTYIIELVKARDETLKMEGKT
jgi:hypothetical protein